MKQIIKLIALICLTIGMINAIVFIFTKDTYWGILSIILYLNYLINWKD